MEEKENRYEVLNKGWDDVKTESRALELLQEAAEELKKNLSKTYHKGRRGIRSCILFRSRDKS